MSTIKRKERLIMVDCGQNNNKFYELVQYDDGRTVSTYGRVGITSSDKDYGPQSDSFFDKTIASKIKKGYSPLKTIDVSAPTTVVKNDLSATAHEQIKYKNPLLKKFIDRLVKNNIHNITSNTQISYNAQTGLFSTPMGIVAQDDIVEARDILLDIKKQFEEKKTGQKYIKSISDYLRIIPQNVGMKLRAEVLFADQDSFDKQNNLLDGLEASYQTFNTAPKNPADPNSAKVVKEKVFDVELDIIDPSDAEFRRVNKWFEDSKKRMHNYDRLRVKQMYALTLGDNIKGYDPANGNIHEVWHGSSEANVLSIMKSGLRVSPPSSAAIAGKLFGNGVYGSKTSSKSLGYTLGRWGQSHSDTGFLFVLDFVMGKAYYPTSYGFRSIPSGYDSCYALPDKTGLHNDELIVYREKHIKIKYLLEIQ